MLVHPHTLPRMTFPALRKRSYNYSRIPDGSTDAHRRLNGLPEIKREPGSGHTGFTLGSFVGAQTLEAIATLDADIHTSNRDILRHAIRGELSHRLRNVRLWQKTGVPVV